MSHAKSGERLRVVVVDTNVFISAFLHPERPLFQILQQATQGRYQLLTSPPIVQEVGRILRERFEIADRMRIGRLKVLVKAAEMITPLITLNVITADPPDNRILECAIEGKADLIVSGNRHLLKLKIYEGIPVVRPTDFLRSLGMIVSKPSK
jgi:putative PIN family toxin of toxin-antitoxin system